MADWTFEFRDSSSQKSENEEKLSSIVPDTMGSGANEKAVKPKTVSQKESFSNTFTEKVRQDSVQSFLISPLNTATGGLASPLYESARSIISGATVGAVAGNLLATVSMMGLQYLIQKTQQRVVEIEKKVNELGNTDNALIRAGSVSKATYYSGNIFGIKTRTDRS